MKTLEKYYFIALLFVSNSGAVNVVFMYLYCYGNSSVSFLTFLNDRSREIDKNTVTGKNDINCLFLHFFLVPRKDATFLKYQKEVRKKNYVIFYFN